MKYISTRDSTHKVDFQTVLLSGMAPGNGLYVPESWPELDAAYQKKLRGMSYSHVAGAVLHKFTADTVPPEKLAEIVHETYHPDVFGHSAVAPLLQLQENLWVMELFHGPTLAFKDYALQFLGRLFDYVLQQRGERMTIVGATSGDTGSAAIEACRHCANVDIFIMHPQGRTSEVQRKQMTTVQAPNVHNIALDGTFDDCQDIVKEMFADEAFRTECNLSAVNSINWARIAAQIAYYFSAALALGAPDRPVSFAVPTGNFGNVFAAHCARRMGLPVKDLIIGTNQNDILTRFFETGRMTKTSVSPSISPSMDIQISSNFERFLFELMGHNSNNLKGLMDDFKTKNEMSVTLDRLATASESFQAYRCSEDQTIDTMRKIHAETGYVLDPHTAVGVHAALQADTDHAAPVIALACAHPAKFPDAVERAIGRKPDVPERLQAVMNKAEFVTALPNDLRKVQEFVKQHRTT